MDQYNKKSSFAGGSQLAEGEFSILSPNKSNISHHTQFGLPPYQPGAKENQYHIFPNIVQDLLNGTEEWRNIQDIIRLTLKALCDVIKDQGMAITDLEKAMYTKANKSEVKASLDTKANITDVSTAITEVAAQLEYKSSLEEVNVMLEEKMSKSELQYLLTNKVSIEELRTLLENKCNVHEVNSQIQSIDGKIETYFRDLKSQQKSFALQKDLSHALVQLEMKADLNDVNESFGNKANKSTVSDALHRKANKKDTEDALKSKIEKSELKDILDSFKSEIESSTSNLISRERQSLVKLDHYKELEEIILSKADKCEIDMYLSAVNTQKKDFDRRVHLIEKETADVLKTVQVEIENMRTSCIETLNRKTDLAEFERLNDEVHTKLGTDSVINLINKAKSDLYSSMAEIKEEFFQSQKKYEESLFERASRAEVNSERTAEDLNNARREIEDLRQITVGIEKDTIEYSKSMYESSRNEFKKDIGRVENDLNSFREDINIRVDNSLLTAEFEKYREDTAGVLENKVDVEEVQKAVTGCQNDYINRINASKQELVNVIDELNTSITPSLERKVDHEELEIKLSELITKSEVNSELENINNHLVKDIRNLYALAEKKADIEEFNSEKDKVGDAFQSIENELGNKINEGDARDLINQKCNIDDVNKALTEIHDELDTKTTSEDFEGHTKIQTEINQALCAENCVARWIWKSGDLKSGFAVPWEVESINTCPENFLWEQDKSNIMTVAPGLYEITFGFFSKKKPTIQLLVNGDPCLSAVNNASYVIHHSSGKLKSSNKQKEGNIAGLTLIDFVALPARARISISFSGESTAEGFLGLRKL